MRFTSGMGIADGRELAVGAAGAAAATFGDGATATAGDEVAAEAGDGVAAEADDGLATSPVSAGCEERPSIRWSSACHSFASSGDSNFSFSPPGLPAHEPFVIWTTAKSMDAPAPLRSSTAFGAAGLVRSRSSYSATCAGISCSTEYRRTGKELNAVPLRAQPVRMTLPVGATKAEGLPGEDGGCVIALNAAIRAAMPVETFFSRGGDEDAMAITSCVCLSQRLTHLGDTPWL